LSRFRRAESDITRFLAYVVAALQTIALNIGAGVLAALQSPQPPPIESILTTLINEITTLPDHFILVLDDYHVIDSQPVDRMKPAASPSVFTLAPAVQCR
jgi:LuxR family maltose regulon positive regulatory protein